MLSFFKFFLHKRQFSYLLIAGITVMGFMAALNIPKESAPEVRIPIGIVTTVLPGATAEDVERLVTNKIEDGLNNLTDLDKISSSSLDGVSVVTVTFTANADLDKSIRDLKDQVDKVKVDLPTEAKEPTVTDVNFADQPMFIVSVSSDLSATDFATLSENLKNEIKVIPGVSKVVKNGVRERQVQVIVDKEKLNDYGLSLAQVVAAISATNASAPVGSLTIDQINYSLRFSGDISRSAELGDIAVLNKNGQPIYLRDIALVSNGVEDATTLSRISVAGAPSTQSITLSVYKKSGGSITTVADAIKARIEVLKQGLLKHTTVLYSFDRSETVKKDLFELVRSGLETVALVMIALFLTLGWREAIIAGLSIPLSFLIAFIGLYYSGNSINFISLFSLILAVGILVDSGIVVVESIHTRLRRHPKNEGAAFETLEEYGWPLIAGTLTNVAVFIPLFFISGITGKFIASIPFTVLFVLVGSIFVALGLLPILAVVFLKRNEDNRLIAVQERYTHLVQNWYRTLLNKLLGDRTKENKLLKWVGGVFLVALLLPMVGLIKSSFFPQGDVDFVYVEIEKPQGTSLAETDLTTRAVEELLYHDKNIDSFITTVGSGSSFTGGGNTGSRYANVTVNLKKGRSENSSQIVERLRKELTTIKNADLKVSQPNNGPPVGAPISIKLSGDDLGKVNSAAEVVAEALRNIPGTSQVDTSAKDDLPDFVLTLNKAKASQYGLNSLIVAQALRTSVHGVTATTIREAGQDLDVNVKLNLNPNYQTTDQTNEATIDTLRQLTINTAAGPILLGSIIDVSIEKSNTLIQHENRARLATVGSQVRDGFNTNEVLKQFKQKQSQLKLDPSVKVSFGGEDEESSKTFADMFKALAFGVLLMFAILILQFNSIRYAFYLIVIVPLSIIGVFAGLLVSRYALSFPSLLGFIALAGTIVNHTIILIDSINLLRRRETAWPLKQVVVEASVVRLRPILLTTITTVIGMIPLTFVSAIWGPLAFSIMFGLSFAVVLTLVLLPVLYYRWPGPAEELN